MLTTLMNGFRNGILAIALTAFLFVRMYHLWRVSLCSASTGATQAVRNGAEISIPNWYLAQLYAIGLQRPNSWACGGGGRLC